jgi:hypothetical protein
MTTNTELVPRTQVAREFGVHHRTICRFEKENKPGFDRAVKIGSRVFHPRSRIEEVKRLGNRLPPEGAI